jgi:hypothetical protein
MAELFTGFSSMLGSAKVAKSRSPCTRSQVLMLGEKQDDARSEQFFFFNISTTPFKIKISCAIFFV